MNNYISLTKIKNQDNNNFDKIFNQIFNKIPYIYSEIFLKLFQTRFRYFTMFQTRNIPFSFTKTLEILFTNIYKEYNYEFFYKYIKEDLSTCLTNDIEKKHIEKLAQSISTTLNSNIEIKLLLDIIDKKQNNAKYFEYNYLESLDKENKQTIYQISESYLIGKALIKIIKILNIYNQNPYLYKKISKSVEKIRTIELIMDNVLDLYDNKYINIIDKNEFKILIYLLILSRNARDIDKNYNYDIDKLFISLGYDTSIKRIINYRRGNDYLEIENNKDENSIANLFSYRPYPYIYRNISEIINILFQKYHDDYTFIINKEKILKKIFYLYIKNIDLYNKIFICTTYKLWSYEWDSIKEKYENTI